GIHCCSPRFSMAWSTGSVGRPRGSSDWAPAETGTARETAIAATAPRPTVLSGVLSESRITGESISSVGRADVSAGPTCRPLDVLTGRAPGAYPGATRWWYVGPVLQM